MDGDRAEPSPSVAGPCFRLFGAPTIEHAGRVVALPPTKPQELLCCLLLHRDRPLSRDVLAELLWPGWDPVASKRYLRQALWKLTSSLRGDGLPTALLLLGPGWVRVDPDTDWWLDVDEFERTHRQTRETAGRDLSEHQCRRLEEALAHYRGDLMATADTDWSVPERERLGMAALAIREQLMEHSAAHGRWTCAVAHGEDILRTDPTRESTHRLLMHVHHEQGDRGSAIRQFRRCERAAARELGVAPAAETVALHEAIRTNRRTAPLPAATGRATTTPAAPGPAAATPAAEETWASALAHVHTRLDEIQATLAALLAADPRRPDGVRWRPPREEAG